MADKFTPIENREYIVTDQCFWENLSPEERMKYNPYDTKRAPHSISLVDAETGTIVNLESGSRVRIVRTKGK